VKPKAWILCLLAHIGLLAAAAGAADSGPQTSFNGYVKSFFTVFSSTDRQAAWFDLDRNAMASMNNRLRLKFVDVRAKNLRLDAAYELVATIQAPDLFRLALFGLETDPGEYRVVDFRSTIYPKSRETGGNFGLSHNLDRLSLTWKLPAADITLGRQVIAWGSARLVNPTDVLIPFSFNELDKEERRGIDAVRVRVPLGAMSELDAGWVPGPDFRLSRGAAFLRGRFSLWNTDLSLLLMDFRRHLLLGLDLARSLGGAGVWLEAAYVVPEAFRGGSEFREPDYFRFSAGADHQLGGKTYAFVEYHFNGAGKRRGTEYADALDTSAYLDGSVYLFGRHYLGAGLSRQVTPLLPLTALFLWNLNDGSAMALVTGEYNIAENIYLSAGAHVGGGHGPELLAGLPPPPGLGIRSEFGLYPDLFFASFRLYF
jgi:hypothetical protein